MLKDWNFWERNFAECVLTIYRLPMKKTQYIQPSGKLPYTTRNKICDINVKIEKLEDKENETDNRN